MPQGMISTDDPRADDVSELLERHLAYANASSPREDVHVLDVDALLDPSVTFFSFRVDGELLGVAALKRLDGRHAQIRSMHTVEAEASAGRSSITASAGFTRCGPFADYRASPESTYMTLSLDRRG